MPNVKGGVRARQTGPNRPRGSLSPEIILTAAERIAASGFEHLSVRAVAAEIGAAPMSLYTHFPTKDRLVSALLDRVLGRLEPPVVTGDWYQDLRLFALAHRRLLDQHPWALSPFFSHPYPGPNAVRIGETGLVILQQAGLFGDDAVAILSGVIALNYGWSSFASAKAAGGAMSMQTAMATLASPQYPGTAAAAGELAGYGSERHYEIVLDRLLTGVRLSMESASVPISKVLRTPRRAGSVDRQKRNPRREH